MSSRERFRFNNNPKVEGSHAFLSPSNYHWLRWSPDKLLDRLRDRGAAERGTRMHAWAAEAILLRRYQPVNGDIVCQYINDALDHDMTPEQSLFASFHCFGTADAIGFDPVEMFLRIYDLKTGITKASVDQLYVYAAIFCLEYGYRPFDMSGELRIYQGEGPTIYDIDRQYLAWVYDTIYTSLELIEETKMEGLG